MNIEPISSSEEEKIAIIGIFILDYAAVEAVNSLLHEYGGYIVGRLGIPFREKGMNIISIIVCADNKKISALCGKLGRIEGIRAKAMQTDIYETSR